MRSGSVTGSEPVAVISVRAYLTLSSYGFFQPAFGFRVIDAVVGGHNSVRTVQSIVERYANCPPMSDRSGRYVVSLFETIFRRGFGRYSHADRSVLTEQPWPEPMTEQGCVNRVFPILFSIFS